MPPVTVAAAVPLEPPLHDTFVPVADTTNTAGSVTVMLVVDVQPFASVTV